MANDKDSKSAAKAEAARRKTQKAMRQLATKVVVGLLILGVVAFFFLPKKGSYSAGSSGATIDGVKEYSNPTGHTLSPVLYPQTPPAGGEHHPTWLNCGIYSEPVPNVYAVHAMEHGAIWVTYDPARLSADELTTLKSYLPSTYAVLSPYVGLPSRIVLSAWNKQLVLDSPTDDRIPAFFEEYWRSQNVPEPGALCTGGIDGPGKSS